MRMTPLHAPDGMTSAGGSSVRFAGVARHYAPVNGGGLAGFDFVQAHERDDDGLVHNHAWAASENAEADGPTGQREAGDGYFGAMPMVASRRHAATTQRKHDADYDDGLVHNHAWAASEK